MFRHTVETKTDALMKPEFEREAELAAIEEDDDDYLKLHGHERSEV